MKIYFAGSIRGGREDKETYAKIIDYLKDFGDILTEHVGNLNLTASGEENGNDVYIYNRDINWIKEADILIAEVTTPSLGVDYELAFAEKLKKPILCLFNETNNRRLSAMITGNTYFKVYKYKTIEEAKEIINDFLQE